MPKKRRPRQPTQDQNPNDPGLPKIAIILCLMIIVAVITMAGCNMALGHFINDLKDDPSHTVGYYE
jgi:hypothetical protein